MFTKNKYLKSCPTIIFEIRGAIIPIKPKIPAAKTLNDVKSAEQIMKNIEYIFLCFTEEKTIPSSSLKKFNFGMRNAEKSNITKNINKRCLSDTRLFSVKFPDRIYNME